MCQCEEVARTIQEVGMDETLELYTPVDFTIGHYTEPGGI